MSSEKKKECKVSVEDSTSTCDSNSCRISEQSSFDGSTTSILVKKSPRLRGGSFVSQAEWVTESHTAFACQVLVPFLICGFGNLGAGQLLDVVQHWKVFIIVPELYVLIPSLMGLKGNLEMTMASRLSTAANCGVMDSGKEIWLMAKGNLALLQCQATVVGFLAAVVAILVNVWSAGSIRLEHAFLMASTSVITANMTSVCLSAVMIVVVIGSRKHKINPDNIATPIASSLGDVTTVAVLAYMSDFFFRLIDKNIWWAPSAMAFFILLSPLTAWYAYRNKYTNRVLSYGWTPIILAMIISSIGGVILDKSIIVFRGIAPYQPVINGVGGNLVAIQASRISTYLHQRFKPRELPHDDNRVMRSPCTTFCGMKSDANIARILFGMAVPAHVLYFYIITLIQTTSITFPFVAMYIFIALFEVLLLLYLARILIYWLWKRASDPDDSAIPLLTATGDLIGTGMLTLGFYILTLLKDPSVLR